MAHDRQRQAPHPAPRPHIIPRNYESDSNKKAGELPLGPWLEGLNARLRQQLKRDARNLQIGHAYLMRITSAAEFTRVLRDELIPLLEEYCYEDLDTLKSILGGSLVDTKNGCIQEDMFEPHREADLLQALRFEEMEGAELAQLAAGIIPEDGDGDDTETANDADDAAS